MATKNTRNAQLQLGTALGGSYTAVTKSHGLKLSVPTDFSEDTGHGAQFKSYLPGLQDFKVTIMAWYDTIYTTLEAMSLNKVSEYFRLYPDINDSLNYYRGQIYVGMDELDLDHNNTAGEKFTAVIANADLQIIRIGAAL